MRTLRESQLYALNLSELGEVERIDDVLTGLSWGISMMAEEFPIIRGTTSLRMVKCSKPLRLKSKKVYLRLWFTIIDDVTVELLSIDAVSAD